METKSMATGKRSFVMYHDQYDIVKELDDEVIGKIMRAVFEYGATGKEPDFDPLTKALFKSFKATMDRDAEKYAETLRKRAEAGRKGGQATQANARSASSKSSKGVANQPDSVSESESVSVSEKNKDIVADAPESAEIESDSCNKKQIDPEQKATVTNKPPAPKPRKQFTPPTQQEVITWAQKWAKDKSKSPTGVIQQAKEAFSYYDRLDWHDASGKKIKSWKMKIAAVWFKDDKIGCKKEPQRIDTF